MMTEAIDSFLRDHPLKSKWLDDIIGVLIERYSGTAHVDDIAKELYGEHRISSIRPTITRRINDFCSDAADFKKSAAHDLFQRVEPATYRLRAHPNRPEIIELINIEFEDTADQSMWELFAGIMRDQHARKWGLFSNLEKISLFAKQMNSNPGFKAEYERRKTQFEKLSL